MHVCKYLFIEIKPQQYPIVQVSRNSLPKHFNSESDMKATPENRPSKWHFDSNTSESGTLT